MTKHEMYNEIWRLNQALRSIANHDACRCVYLRPPTLSEQDPGTIAGFAHAELTDNLLDYAPINHVCPKCGSEAIVDGRCDHCGTK